MLSQRILQQSMRQLAQTRSQSAAVSQRIAPAVHTAFVAQRRNFNTTKSASNSTASRESETSQILINQRLYRPVSPHLGIYRPQITWVASSLNRITGVILSGGFYLFGGLYLLGPALGLKFGSAALVTGFAKWPAALKVASKLFVAAPFVFHSLQGIRHFVWDLGLAFKNKQVIQTGWAVVGLTLLGSVALLFA